jgi:hypothetical protein
MFSVQPICLCDHRCLRGIVTRFWEALSAGLPVLVSDIPEQVEVLKAPNGDIAGDVLPLTNRDKMGSSDHPNSALRGVIEQCAARSAYAGGELFVRPHDPRL